MRAEDLITGIHGMVGMHYKRPPLESATKLAAGNHFLARIAAFFEINTAYRLVVDHLRDKCFYGWSADASHATTNLCPVPQVKFHDFAGRGRAIAWGNPQLAGVAQSGMEIDD
jgi:hypothetical protein